MQGRHGLQGPEGLGLVWILQNRKRRHAADVAATVKALPATQIGCGGPVMCTNKAALKLPYLITPLSYYYVKALKALKAPNTKLFYFKGGSISEYLYFQFGHVLKKMYKITVTQIFNPIK